MSGTATSTTAELLEELLDRERIRDLIARYPMAFDDRDWAAWDELWTDDLVWVVDGAEIVGLPAVIDLAPDRQSATARTDVVWIAQNYENTIVARYEDVLVKVAGRWKISRRDEVVVPFRPGPPPMSEESKQLSGATMRADGAA